MNADGYARLHGWLAARRRWVWIAAGALLAVAGLAATRLRFDEDIYAILPAGDPLVDQYRYALEKFRQIDRVYIDVAGPAAAADAVYEGLRGMPGLERIVYRVGETDHRRVGQLLAGALPNLFTEADAAALADRLEPARGREHLATMRRKLAGPEGFGLADLVAADPVGMSALVAQRLLPLQTGFGAAHVEDGRVVSADGGHILIVAEPVFGSSDLARSRLLVGDLLALAAEAERRFPGTAVAVTGGHRMTVDNARLIRRDALLCTVVGVAAMAVLCLSAFRRRWLALAVFLPTLAGTVVAAAVLAGAGVRLSAIAMGFAAIAIGITVDYAIHVIYHLDEAAGLDAAAAGRHLARLVLPIGVGALTSVAAFVVMTTSPLRVYHQLGAFGAIGVLVSAAFALVILPVLVQPPRRGTPSPLWLSRAVDGFFGWRQRQRAWLLVLTAALTVGAAAGLPRLRFEGDIGRLNGITPATRHDEELIRQTWGEALGMTLVVARGATVEEALARNDAVAARLATLPGVTATYSLASICPSPATQADNRRRWAAFWTADRQAALRETLATAGRELGYRPGAFAPFWETVAGEPAPVTVAGLAQTPLAQVLAERVALGADDQAVATLVKLADRRQTAGLRAALPDGTLVVDRQEFADHIAALARSGLDRFAWWTAAAVAVIIYFALGSAALTLVTLAPLALGLVWTLGSMAWLGLPVDMMNCVFVIFILGVGEDYAVFLVASRLDAWRGRPARLASSGAAVLISALTTLLGFGVLVFARHPVLWSLGVTVVLGMTFTVVATVVLTLWGADRLLREPARRPADPRAQVILRYRYQGQWAEQFVYWKLKTDPMYARLDDVVPRAGFILDLGSGYGQGTHWLAATGPERQLLGVDYDAGKIRVARQSARGQTRVRFEHQDLFGWEFPACDAVLLLDVLHYWQPEKQQQLLEKARRALRPRGRLIVRDAARSASEAHRRVEFWERLMTRTGRNRTVEGLHFLTAEDLTAAVRRAGFERVEVNPTSARDSNVLLTAATPG